MTSEYPSSSMAVSASIFRPWQVAQAKEKSEKSSKVCDTKNNSTSPVSLISSTSSPRKNGFSSIHSASTSPTICLNASSLTSLYTDSSNDSSTSLKKVVPRKKKIMKKEQLNRALESSVSSSTSASKPLLQGSDCRESLAAFTRKRHSAAFEEPSPKRPKVELEEQEPILPSHHPYTEVSLSLSSFDVSHNLQPQIISFMPSSHFQMQANNQFMNPLIPLLEPPIFVPASEVERVCARRPRPKRFSCGECGAAFSNRGQLSGHCRIHTGERPFRCSQPGCGKRFTRNEELTRHRRIHSGLRPFACGVCPKRFGRKDHLKKHLRTHARHVLPQIPQYPHFAHFQHFQHVQQLQQLHHLQQIQQIQMQMPLLPLHQETKPL